MNKLCVKLLEFYINMSLQAGRLVQVVPATHDGNLTVPPKKIQPIWGVIINFEKVQTAVKDSFDGNIAFTTLEVATIVMHSFVASSRHEIAWGSHMASHYTRGSVTTLHDVEGVLGGPLDTSFWALTIPWPRLLARV